MTTLRVALLHLRIGVLNDLQYRVNFALQILQSLLALVTGLVVFSLVYSHTAELNGWTQNELLAVLGVQIMMAGVIHAVIQPNMMRLTEEVQEGKLDHALTKPVDIDEWIGESSSPYGKTSARARDASPARCGWNGTA